ncbi:MAG: ABC transporter ATP-binding protein [bacterium]|nr:MAG: ABC transporter ATP-binding protein [bacterium]
MSKAILDVKDLKKHYSRSRGLVSALRGRDVVIPAIDGISFYIRENETMGLVGESGCGKTTVGRSIMGLTPITSGQVLFDGEDLSVLPPSRFLPYRRQMQMIFQDLDAALNPKMRVRSILREAVTVFDRPGNEGVDRRIRELLDQVNLKESKLTSFPHELSGGEKRRVGIARALAVGARFLVADEPTSALDVSIQAQIVNLLVDLQRDLGLSYLFISHDLRIVELISHKVAVMYLGKIVEMGLAGSIANRPLHPYTRMLWSSMVDGRSLEGSPSPGGRGTWGSLDFERPQAGCRFASRCPVYRDRGRPAVCTDPSTEPELLDVGRARKVACHFPLQ